MQKMKTPSECRSIEDIREVIDLLDSKIISLLASRYQYVKEIVKYKEQTPESIIAKPRYDAVLQSRREMAIEAGISPDIIETIYTKLINHFIDEEMKIIDNN